MRTEGYGVGKEGDVPIRGERRDGDANFFLRYEYNRVSLLSVAKRV